MCFSNALATCSLANTGIGVSVKNREKQSMIATMYSLPLSSPGVCMVSIASRSIGW